jgi:hypothetical protein
MTKTLLEQAKSTPVRPKTLLNEKELDALAVAWVMGEVSSGQASKATNKTGSSLYGLLAVALKRIAQAGRIKVI